MALAVKSIDAGKAQELRAFGCCARQAPGHRRRARAGVDLLHAAIGARFFGRAGHQHAALVHHRDALRKAEHAVDVVLDDQHGDIAGDGLDQMRDAFAFGCGEAGQRLVEQQDMRF